jgi:hypothetical protein
MQRFLVFAGAVAIVLCGIGRANAVVITSTFTASTEGWTSSGSNIAQVPAGGNPGGYLSSTDASSSVATLFAPGPFTGDLSAFDGGTLAFDTILIKSNGGGSQAAFGTVSITDGITTASLNLVNGPTPISWTTFSASLDAATWGLSNAAWTTLLSGVTSISLIIESTFGQGEIVGLDNFSITSADIDPVIPEPSSIVLLLIGSSGAAGYRFLRRKKQIAA